MKSKNRKPVILTVSLILCAATSLHAQPSKIRRAGPDRIENQYIVVLEDDVLPEHVPDVARQLAAAHGAELRDVWFSTIRGFWAVMPEARAEALSRNPRVKYVEENARLYLSSSMSTNVNPADCDPTTTVCAAMSDNRLWHLDRADQNYADPNNQYSYGTTGNGVTVYVVDTGVVGTHAELNGRVQAGFNATGDFMPANDPCLGFALPPTGTYSYVEEAFYTREWQGGHGTAVASALGGRRVGIAKNVTIVPVKVSRCDYNSARYRVAARSYVQNETMFIVDEGGYFLRGLYRARNNGTTSGSTDPISTWPVGTAGNPRPRRWDDGVEWEFVPWSDQISTSVAMMTAGLNWILSPDNPGPKSYAVVTLSMAHVASAPGVGALEEVIGRLLEDNLTVIASANNQNGNACDTSPARLSRGNPNSAIAKKVITVGGTMILNQPWSANCDNPPSCGETPLADGAGVNGMPAAKGTEPVFDATKGVRDGRWICGPGDSDPCSNETPRSTVSPTSESYAEFTGGSNGGPCVTLFAPAKNLFLARNTGPNDYRDARLRAALASGTSWSAPIVAGFAARILEANGNLTPDQVYNMMMQNVSTGVLDAESLDPYETDGVTKLTGTPNKLLRLNDVNITAPPQSTTIFQGASTTLAVTAGGTSAVHYQWYQVSSTFDRATYPRGAHPPGSSTPIGTDSNTLQVTPTATTAYWVRVSSDYGSADSDIVTVTVNCAPPAINGITSSHAVTSGASALLESSATGSGTLSYQWYVGASGNTSTPAGAPGNSVTVTPGSTTEYWLRVTNTCSGANSASVDSATITLTVVTAPTTAMQFYVLPPCRVIDTRDPDGPYGGPALAPGGTRTIQFSGQCGIPSDAKAVAVNIAAVLPSSLGFLALYPANESFPGTSTVNYKASKVIANNAIVKLSPAGQINVFNNPVGSLTHFVIDINGYFK